jgi:hypothetical protein
MSSQTGTCAGNVQPASPNLSVTLHGQRKQAGTNWTTDADTPAPKGTGAAAKAVHAVLQPGLYVHSTPLDYIPTVRNDNILTVCNDDNETDITNYATQATLNSKTQTKQGDKHCHCKVSGHKAKERAHTKHATAHVLHAQRVSSTSSST